MDELSPLLTTYAYNILGSLDEAKDVVQDAFFKFMQIGGDHIENKRAYLVRTVINLSINQKKKQEKIISGYPGEWLPEPVATEKADSSILQKDVLSYSLMVLLEKLSARQRAVFILKEAFDYEHGEIADVLGITIENSRKILSRAKEQLQSGVSAGKKEIPGDYLEKYLQVISRGDTVKLEKMLTDDITVVSDGGGKVVAFRKPVIGKKSVIALLTGLQKKFYGDIHFERGWINHQPAIFYYEGGRLANCQVFSLSGGKLDHIFFIRNPEKLKSLDKIISPKLSR
jgi:RNA polymerase sigma-70 factor (ECF subfamily)